MPSLRLKNVPNPVSGDAAFEEVDVSQWFGEDENGDPYTINVFPLTVFKKNLLQKTVNDYEKITKPDGTETIGLVPNMRHDASCVIAAICSYDDDEQLVFGIDYQDAIERVEAMPEKYRMMVLALSSAAIKLTGGTTDSKTGVEEAKKNSEETP